MKVYSENAIKEAMVCVLFQALDNPNITCGEVQRILKDIDAIYVPLDIIKMNNKDMAIFKCKECGTVYGYAEGEWGEQGVWSPISLKKEKWLKVVDGSECTSYRCPRCGEYHCVESYYCPSCGLKLEESADD